MAVPSGEKRSRTNAYLLISEGFDELEVVYYLHTFRRSGIGIKSVSLFDRMVSSNQGVALRADIALADVQVDQLRGICLILPSGGTNGEKLRRDPRVKGLLESVVAQGGHVVVSDRDSELASDIERVLRDSSAPPSDDEANRTFVDELAWRLAHS